MKPCFIYYETPVFFSSRFVHMSFQTILFQTFRLEQGCYSNETLETETEAEQSCNDE
jgi:hypothetical protein